MKGLHIICGAISACLLNYLLLDKVIIPDPCYYHGHDTTWLFDLFYDITSADGYHPFPSVFNFIFTISAGGVIGYFVYRKWRTAQKSSEPTSE